MFETLGLQFVIHNYQWSGSQLGLVISLCGMVGVAFLLGFKQILTIATDIDWVMYGLIIMTISCLLLMNYGGAVVPLNCYYTSVILMYAIGYPIGHTAVIAMFSRIVKSGPQGTLQGYFAASGSLARVILPLLAGLVTQYYGEHIFFFAIGVCLGITCVIYCTTKKYFEMVVS